MRLRPAALTSSTLRFAALALLAAPVGAQTPTATEDPALVGRYQQTITPAELAGHLYVYADDYMAGRDTGEPGQRFAALYLAGQYQTMGIAPKGTGSASGPYNLASYLQPFALERSQLQSLTVTATRGGETIASATLAPGATDGALLVPAYASVEDASPAPVVFVGHADDAGLQALPLDGAYALVLPGTPANPGDQAVTQTRLRALQARGVRGAILVSAPTASALQQQAARAFAAGRLTLPTVDEEQAELPPIFLTGADVADQMLSGVGQSVTDAAPVETGVMLAIDAARVTETVETENVAAFIEGSDPILKDEVVVVSAHLDHVGTRDVPEGEDAIYNGADDDGSGTVTLLELAEAFHRAKEDGHGPRRSVLFLHVTAEEKGLFGSEYYADVQPLVPLANTVANLNIDMIGRHDPQRGFETTDYVYIIGGDLISQDIHDWNAAVNEATGTDLLLSDRFNSPDDPNRFFARSDHWNFGKHGVPFIFYFTGTHADYHQPGDEADKIDYDRMATIARLVFGTAWELANRDERPAVSGAGFN